MPLVSQGELIGLLSLGSPKTGSGCWPKRLVLTALVNTSGWSDFLLSELTNFTGEDWEQEDDITLVTLERSEEL